MTEEEVVPRTIAAERLRAHRDALVKTLETERLAPDRLAGRTLAEAVTAPRDVPPVDFATMDGFAVSTADTYPLTVVGTVQPSDEQPILAPGETVRVATGAPLPARADAVLPREDATVIDGQLTGPSLDAGTNRFPAGGTATLGERLFEPGTKLAPRHAALLADVGVDYVTVYRRFSVGILATGTEIHEGTQPDRDSEMLASLVRSWGHDPTVLAPFPDDESAVRTAIEDAAAAFDLVVTSGGTSVGLRDHVGGVLAAHDPLFSGVSLRPGRPVTAAVVGDTLVCALPGKPLAAHTAATVVLRPAFTGSSDLPTVSAEASTRVELPPPDLEYAVPVCLVDGRARPVGQGESAHAVYGTQFRPGRVASSTRATVADGVVITREPLVSGNSVQVVPYEVVE